MPKNAIEWKPYDWRSGSTHPTYSSLGRWYAPLSLQETATTSIHVSFKEVQEWVADACANCIFRHLKEENSIWCMKWQARNNFDYNCKLYQKDDSLDKIRGV